MNKVPARRMPGHKQSFMRAACSGVDVFDLWFHDVVIKLILAEQEVITTLGLAELLADLEELTVTLSVEVEVKLAIAGFNESRNIGVWANGNVLPVQLVLRLGGDGCGQAKCGGQQEECCESNHWMYSLVCLVSRVKLAGPEASTPPGSYPG